MLNSNYYKSIIVDIWHLEDLTVSRLVCHHNTAYIIVSNASRNLPVGLFLLLSIFVDVFFNHKSYHLHFRRKLWKIWMEFSPFAFFFAD